MRKVMLALSVLFLTVGLALAAPGRLVKYDEDKKEMTVKSGKKGSEVEKTYKVTDKTTFTDGDKEITMEEAVKKMTAKKGGKYIDVTAGDGETAKSVKFLAPKKKNDKQ
jgi:ABC-type glycerol-3-phosphate transport system substrate-binding protein